MAFIIICLLCAYILIKQIRFHKFFQSNENNKMQSINIVFSYITVLAFIAIIFLIICDGYIHDRTLARALHPYLYYSMALMGIEFLYTVIISMFVSKEKRKAYEKEYWENVRKREEERQQEINNRIAYFHNMKMGMYYSEVAQMIGNKGLLLSSKSANGINVQSKNFVCPNCGGAYDSTKDDVCPFCGAINIKDTVVIKDDFVQDEYIWYFDDRSVYIKAIFKNDKLISKVQQGLY